METASRTGPLSINTRYIDDTSTENAPFLNSSQPSSPSLRNSPRLSSGALSPRSSPYLNEKAEFTPYSDDPNNSSLPLPASAAAAAALVKSRSRSRLRLVLLSILAVGALIGIATWQAPDHVKTTAAEYIQSATDQVDQYWQSAKEWSGYNSVDEPATSPNFNDDVDTTETSQQTADENQIAKEKQEEWVPHQEELQTTGTSSKSPSETETELETDEQKAEEQKEQESGDDDADKVQEMQDAQVSPDETLDQPDQHSVDETPLAEEAEHKNDEPAAPIAVPQTIEDVKPEAHPLYVLPSPFRKPSGDPNEKFLSFLPHSGFHNQRIALYNGMMLAHMTSRTLLLPPAWIGWPVTTRPFRALQAVWDDQSRKHPQAFTPKAGLARRQKAPAVHLTEDQCKSYAKECKATYQDTFVSWDFLTDLTIAEREIKMVDRWNMTQDAMYKLLGIQSEEEVYLLEDTGKYWFHFHDREEKEHPEMISKMTATKYEYTVSIPQLLEATKNHKLLELGSLFGSGRIAIRNPANERLTGYFQRAQAFRNPILNNPANEISMLMGGADGYLGVHARVGDGWFKTSANESMQHTFRQLLEKLEIPEAEWAPLFENASKRSNALLEEEAKQKSIRGRHLQKSDHVKRSLLTSNSSPESFVSWSGLDDEEFESQPVDRGLSKRQVSEAIYSTQLQPITSRSQMRLAPQLKCRGALHTDPRYLVLNNPIYIATDARSPLTNPHLSYYFANFPCAFVLSDFDKTGEFNEGQPVHSLKEMEASVNELDGVKLGRLFLPFMEAMVAAKGAECVGTQGSTFSGFASGALHAAYWLEAHGRTE